MAEQTYATAPSRNPAVAAQGFGSGAMQGKVPAPSGKLTLGKAPEPGISGPVAGSPAGGFGSALIDGKVKV